MSKELTELEQKELERYERDWHPKTPQATHDIYKDLKTSYRHGLAGGGS